MGLKCIDVLATIILNLIHTAYSQNILSCDINSPEPCPDSLHQTCDQETSKCVCDKGYILVGKECVIPSDNSQKSTAIVAVVTLFTLALILVGLFLVTKKYNLVTYVRQKINARRNNDIMYEDVMIDQDDPPLNP